MTMTPHNRAQIVKFCLDLRKDLDELGGVRVPELGELLQQEDKRVLEKANDYTEIVASRLEKQFIPLYRLRTALWWERLWWLLTGRL